MAASQESSVIQKHNLVDDVNEESLAEDRLKARLSMAGEGALAGAAVDGMIKTLRIIKNDPRLLRCVCK